MTSRALLLLAAAFSLSVSLVGRAASVPVSPAHHTATPFGIPLPQRHDQANRQQWRQLVQAQIESRRARLHANAASGGSAGIIETLAGAAPFQKPVNALKTGFGDIWEMTEDSGGNLFVASCDLGAVLKIDPSSNATVYAGRPLAVGPAISAGDGGPATSARIACPAGLALDASNNLYVTDAFSATVREVVAATGIIQTVAGTPGHFGHAGDGGPGTSAVLEYPTGVALDGQGNLFIEDQDYIWRLNLTTGVIQTFAGSGVISNPCPPSAATTCPALQTNFYFDVPGIVAHGGYLYAAPHFISYAGGSLDSSIVSINLSSGSVQLLAGGGASAGTPTSTYPAIGTQAYMTSLAADGGGNLLFSGQYQAWSADQYANPNPYVDGIFELMASDNSVRGLAGTNTPSNTTGDGGPATSAGIAFAKAVCLSTNGNVLFSDGSFNIRTFPIGGNLSTIAGNGWPNFFGDNGPAQQAGLDQPIGVATDAQGNVYVADSGNDRARRIDAATGVITTAAGGALPQNVDEEFVPALQPVAVALDQNNHLYVRSEGAITTVDLTSGAVSTLVTNVTSTGQMSFDGSQTLYYASALNYLNNKTHNDGIWAVNVTTGATTQIAGAENVFGPIGDGGPALQAGLYDVEGLALDGQNLYLADSTYQNVRVIDLNTGIISKIGGTNSGGGSLIGYSGDGGPATAAAFNGPAGLAYDGAGHLTIADSHNHVLRQIDLATNIITTIAGNHTPGFGGDGGPAGVAMLYDPMQAAYDPSGNLIIADSENYRIRRILLHPTTLNATLTDTQSSDGSITFTATYTGLSFGFAPTGTVTFSSGSTSLGSGILAPASDGSGTYVATFTAANIPANGATVTAQYSGDVHYAAVSKTLSFQQPSYTVASNPASLSIQQGSSGSITFTVTPQNGFHEQVSFACDASTLPRGVTCSFTPAPVTPDGSNPATTTLTVQTTGATIASLHQRSGRPGWLPRGGAMLALVVLLIPPMRRRSWLGAAAVLLLVVSFGGISGCSGGSATTNNGGTQNPNATPPGSYAIHVNTTAGTQQGAAPVTVTLTVKS